MSEKVYEIVTNRIIESLTKGIIPWKRPWEAYWEAPKNFVSKKEYRGINSFILAMRPDRYFLTFTQCKNLGGSIRPGEKATPVIFWKVLEKETSRRDKDGKPVTDKIPMLRYFNVFGLSQCSGIEASILDAPKTMRQNERIEACEKIVSLNNPKINVGGFQPSYRPSTDTIQMTEINNFDDSESYYATLFHEMIHWTGHESRLNRKQWLVSNFGSSQYAKEELVAEMGSAFMSAITQIDTPKIKENETAYIQNWLTALRNDAKMVVHAAAQAQKATDWLKLGGKAK